MTNQTTTKRQRRMAREPKSEATREAKAKAPSRLDQLEQLLTRHEGAAIAEMIEATGWQKHSVRGAMAGALKKRGLVITSEKVDTVRRYHASRRA